MDGGGSLTLQSFLSMTQNYFQPIGRKAVLIIKLFSDIKTIFGDTRI